VHSTRNGFVCDVVDYEVHSSDIFFHITCIVIIRMDFLVGQIGPFFRKSILGVKILIFHDLFFENYSCTIS
jgi:hypothetical protein